MIFIVPRRIFFTSTLAICIGVSLLVSGGLHAQSFYIKGKVVDAANNSSVAGASVSIRTAADSTILKGVITDTSGKFMLTGLVKSKYIIKISFFGYKPLIAKVELVAQNLNLGAMKLSEASLKEVKIVGHEKRAEMIGDTVQYSADAFKTNPDATAEDLVTKMPGIVVNTDGSVQAHGETVKQVLVDGKPFFGDDPTTALRNLPAEVIDKVQVYDKLSDQSQFTGFDDGNSQKTINIITKKYRRNGQFGKATVGGGTDGKYTAGETFNDFNNNFRLSVIGLSNNVNQQNFASQDLLGVLGGGGGGRSGGRGGPAIGGGGLGGYQGGASNNFLVGNQNGINHTNSAGTNFSDSIGKKTYVTASYFFNNGNNNTQSSLAQTYFTTTNQVPVYDEQDQSNTNNFNHRANVRVETAMDSMNSLIFTPKFNYQQTFINSSMSGTNIIAPSDTTSADGNHYYNTSSGYDFNANLLLRHKFRKKGRTISWNLGTDINPKNANDTLHAVDKYFARDSTSIINQRSSSPSKSLNFNTNIAYTEPLGKLSMIQANYSPSYTQSSLNKVEYSYNALTGEYVLLDTALSNSYSYTTLVNKGGLSYHLKSPDNNRNFMVALNYQDETLTGTQTFPVSSNGEKNYNFSDLLPMAIFNEKFADKSSLRMFYLTNTSLPSITQLQNVVNNTNPLLLSTGNPDLHEQYTHTFITRYGKTAVGKAQSFFMFFTASLTENYIGNSTIISDKDSILPGGYRFAKGSQLTLPVNLNNNWSTKAFATYGLPFDVISSNINFNGGVSYASSPGLLNYKLNYANTWAFNPGLVFSSNISEKVDYTLSYNSTYNIVKNTLNASANSNYFTHLADFKFNWIFYKGFTFNCDISHTLYTGLGSYNQSLFLVNGGFGKKFLKYNAGELKLYVFDALNQNQSISRTITAAYVADVRTVVLQRYLMLSFTYSLRHYTTGGVIEKDNPDQHDWHPGMGGPPPVRQ